MAPGNGQDISARSWLEYISFFAVVIYLLGLKDIECGGDEHAHCEHLWKIFRVILALELSRMIAAMCYHDDTGMFNFHYHGSSAIARLFTIANFAFSVVSMYFFLWVFLYQWHRGIDFALVLAGILGPLVNGRYTYRTLCAWVSPRLASYERVTQ